MSVSLVPQNFHSEINKQLAEPLQKSREYAERRKSVALTNSIALTIILALSIALVIVGCCSILPSLIIIPGILGVVVITPTLFFSGNIYTANKNMKNILLNFNKYISEKSQKTEVAGNFTTKPINKVRKKAVSAGRYFPFIPEPLSSRLTTSVKNAVTCNREKIKEDMKKGTFAFTSRTNEMADSLWNDDEDQAPV